MRPFSFSPLVLLSTGLFAFTASAAEPQAEWTIMVFLNADNNLEPFGIKDFQEMAAVGSTDKVNIIVQFDRVPGEYTDPANDWTGTRRFRVTKNMKPTPGQALENLGEVNMGDGNELADFVSWATEKYPAKRNMLIIWNHGQGWRYFERTQLREPAVDLLPKQQRDVARADEGQRLRPSLEKFLAAKRVLRSAVSPTLDDPEKNWRVLPINQAVSGVVRYVSSDDTSNDHLYNREIQDSLEALGTKLDVIGFDACLMAMIETGYAMRNVAKVMVASEELEPGAGWQYTLWLKPLIDDPAMDAEQLGRQLVQAYRTAYGSIDPETTLSAVRLGKMTQLAASVGQLADACQEQLENPTERSKIFTARNKCQAYAPGQNLHGVDLGFFCEQIAANAGDATLRDLAEAARNKVQDCVIENYVGADREEDDDFGSRGLAIYFPRSYSAFYFDPDREGYLESNTNYPVQFVQDHTWDNFLHAYFAVAP